MSVKEAITGYGVLVQEARKKHGDRLTGVSSGWGTLEGRVIACSSVSIRLRNLASVLDDGSGRGGGKLPQLRFPWC